MKRAATDTGLTVLAITLAAIAAQRWRAPLGPAPYQSALVAAMPETAPREDSDSLDTAAGTIIDTDPFRLSQTPPTVAFAKPGAPTATLLPTVARPSLVLKGIVGGPPWQGIVDGLPGQPPGTAVQAGDAFDKLTVRRVTRDSVILQSPDTVWRLTLTHPTP